MNDHEPRHTGRDYGHATNVTAYDRGHGLLEPLWFLMIFFRPRLFFRRLAREGSPIVTASCAFTYGVTRTIDRMDTRISMGEAPFIDSWAIYWGIALFAGVFGAALLFAIGGWWYRLRVKWSGDPNPDKTVARRVYVYAAQVVAVPALLLACVEASIYATPLEAADAPLDVFDWLVIAALFYSYVVSFIGVRTTFDVGTKRSAWWFLVLPSLLALIAVGVILVAVYLITQPPPDTRSPLRVTEHDLRLSYPGNWTLDETFVDLDGVTEVTIRPPQDAFARVTRFRSDASPGRAVSMTASRFDGVFDSVRRIGDVTTLGAHSGSGGLYRVDAAEAPYLLRIFVTDGPTAGDGVLLEFQSMCREDEHEKLEPGFALIYESMQ